MCSVELFNFLFFSSLDEDGLTFLIDTKFFFTFNFLLLSLLPFDTFFDFDGVELVLSVLGLKRRKQNDY